jgi:hypothetical protein
MSLGSLRNPHGEQAAMGQIFVIIKVTYIKKLDMAVLWITAVKFCDFFLKDSANQIYIMHDACPQKYLYSFQNIIAFQRRKYNGIHNKLYVLLLYVLL